MHPYVSERLGQEHREDVQREVERERLASQIPQASSVARHLAVFFGLLLIYTGRRLIFAAHADPGLQHAGSAKWGG